MPDLSHYDISVASSLPRRSLADAVIHVRQGLAPAVVAVGVGGGLVGAAYVAALHGLQRLLGPGDHRGLVQLAILVAAGAAVALITRLLGETGDVELLVDNIHVLGGAEDARRLRPSSRFAAVRGIGWGDGPGGSVGPEHGHARHVGRHPVGPRPSRCAHPHHHRDGGRVHGAVRGPARLGLCSRSRSSTGAACSTTRRCCPPSSARCAATASTSLSGAGIEPVWSFGPVGTLHGGDLVHRRRGRRRRAIGLRIFTLLEAGAKRLPADLRPVLGGVVLAGLGALSPWALTYGETQLGELAGAHLAIAALVAIAALKLVATSVTLASDWKGGFIIPLFFMGATLGQLAHHALPGTNETLLMATMMVALCVGVTKTPLGTTLVVTEMAGLPLLPVTLIAAIVALVLSRPVTLIETQRARHPESRTAL